MVFEETAHCALSTAEAEYMALASAMQEALWLHAILQELSLQQHKPTTIYSNNLSAIALSNDPAAT